MSDSDPESKIRRLMRESVTGELEEPASDVLTSEERVMLDYFRQASPHVRKAALGALLSAAPGGTTNVGIKRGFGNFAIGSIGRKN